MKNIRERSDLIVSENINKFTVPMEKDISSRCCNEIHNGIFGNPNISDIADIGEIIRREVNLRVINNIAYAKYTHKYK